MGEGKGKGGMGEGNRGKWEGERGGQRYRGGRMEYRVVFDLKDCVLYMISSNSELYSKTDMCISVLVVLLKSTHFVI